MKRVERWFFIVEMQARLLKEVKRWLLGAETQAPFLKESKDSCLVLKRRLDSWKSRKMVAWCWNASSTHEFSLVLSFEKYYLNIWGGGNGVCGVDWEKLLTTPLSLNFLLFYLSTDIVWTYSSVISLFFSRILTPKSTIFSFVLYPILNSSYQIHQISELKKGYQLVCHNMGKGEYPQTRN